jgi:hypothetical protein
MDRSIRAGISGAILAVVIELFVPIPIVFFNFIPPFFAAIFIIVIFRLKALKDGLVAAFMTYILNEGISGTISLVTFYITNPNQPFPSFNVDILTVFYPIVNSITALTAGYVGVRLAQRMRPTHELPPSLPPPLPPV